MNRMSTNKMTQTRVAVQAKTPTNRTSNSRQSMVNQILALQGKFGNRVVQSAISNVMQRKVIQRVKYGPAAAPAPRDPLLTWEGVWGKEIEKMKKGTDSAFATQKSKLLEQGPVEITKSEELKDEVFNIAKNSANSASEIRKAIDAFLVRYKYPPNVFNVLAELCQSKAAWDQGFSIEPGVPDGKTKDPVTGKTPDYKVDIGKKEPITDQAVPVTGDAVLVGGDSDSKAYEDIVRKVKEKLGAYKDKDDVVVFLDLTKVDHLIEHDVATTKIKSDMKAVAGNDKLKAVYGLDKSQSMVLLWNESMGFS